MNPDQLEKEFVSRGHLRCGLLLLSHSHAMALIRRARAERIPILGLDGFHVHGDTLQPDMAHSVDLSSLEAGADTWEPAERFLEERRSADLQFEVVLGDVE
jgi:hypothetical protein